MDLVHSPSVFLWSGSINSTDKQTPIAVSLSDWDFHESLQLQVCKEEVFFGTEASHYFADNFVDFPPSLPSAGLS